MWLRRHVQLANWMERHLEPNELEDWKNYCAETDDDPDELATDLEEVEMFRAYRLYHSLVASNHPSVQNIPCGEFVMVHPTNGVVCYGPEDILSAREEDHEYMFQHKPQLEHLRVCKVAHGIQIPGSSRCNIFVRANGHHNYVANLTLLVGMNLVVIFALIVRFWIRLHVLPCKYLPKSQKTCACPSCISWRATTNQESVSKQNYAGRSWNQCSCL